MAAEATIRPSHGEFMRQLEEYVATSTKKRSKMAHSSLALLQSYMTRFYASNKPFTYGGMLDFFAHELAHLATSSKETVMVFMTRFLLRYRYITRDELNELTSIYKGEKRNWSDVSLTEETIELLIKYLNDYKREYGVFAFLAGTLGLRINQALSLTMADVEITNEKIKFIVVKQKQNAHRNETQREVKQMFRTTQLGRFTVEDYIIPYIQQRQKNSSDKSLLLPSTQVRTVQSWFQKFAQQSGITYKLTPHSLRHYVGNKVANKHGVFAAAALLGHEDIKTTQKYINKSTLDTSNFI
jgi:integrase